MPVELRGILPAVVTPLNDRGAFQEAAYERLCASLYAAGADGLYVCGQTGEGLQQDLSQRKRVVEASVRCSPAGKIVMAHIGAPATAQAVELARHAEATGVHAISSLPPAGAYGMDEVCSYYEALAAATDLPLLVYFFPNFAATPRTLEDLTRLCAIPRVAGLKFTSMDLYTMGELKRQGATIFNGYDELLVAGLLMGADGGIGSFYNVVPEWFVELYRHTQNSEWPAARGVQGRINELIRIGLRYPVHAAVKEMVRWRGVDCGACVSPRRGLTAIEIQALHADLERVELTRSFAA